MLKSPISAPNVVAQPEFPGSYIAGLPEIRNAWSPQIEALAVAPDGKQAIRPRVGPALLVSTGEAPFTFPVITRSGKVRTPSYTPNTGTQEWSAPVSVGTGWNSVFVVGEHASFNHEIFRLWLTAEFSIVGNPWVAGGATGCMLRHHNQTTSSFTDLVGIPHVPAATPFWWVAAFNLTTGEVKSRNSLSTTVGSVTSPLLTGVTPLPQSSLLFGRMRSGRHYDGYLFDVGFAQSDLIAEGLTNLTAYTRALLGIS